MGENDAAKRQPEGHGLANDEQVGRHAAPDVQNADEHQGGGPNGDEAGALPVAVTDVPMIEGEAADGAWPEATTDIPMPDVDELVAPPYGRP